jgi:hypothetical protein
MYIGYVYKIENPNGKVYIGQTTNINERIRKYKRLSCKTQPAIYNSLLKYGFDEHIIDILEIVNDSNFLSDREVYWINEFDSYNNGLNCTRGGDGGSPFAGHKHTDESKMRISRSLKGRIVSSETIQKLIFLNTGEKNHMFGKKQSLESNRKRSLKLKNNKNGLNKGKKIFCVELEMTFDTITQASKYLEASNSWLAICIKNNKSYKGLNFKIL